MHPVDLVLNDEPGPEYRAQGHCLIAPKPRSPDLRVRLLRDSVFGSRTHLGWRLVQSASDMALRTKNNILRFSYRELGTRDFGRSATEDLTGYDGLRG
jgi:hypothetical protein